MADVTPETEKKLVDAAERQARALERIADKPAPVKRSWMCQDGRSGTCFGPWGMCLIFGCAVRR